jgi:Ser-tRNA(Ala) deacylase AlaX/transcriptional regulator with XRE-family HTH domain
VSIGGVPVVEVVDEEDRIAHRLAAPAPAEGPNMPVDCSIDWDRRFDHMQQHSGQHLISAVFEELFGLKTVSFHLGAESATIDIEGPPVDARTLFETERRANRIVCENRPLTVQFQHAAEAHGLRKPSEREGTLRIVSIEGLDRSACGGTHVRATGEIGAVLLRRVEKIRQAVRVEFLCGARAVRRAHADYEALSKAAQLFCAPLDEVPAVARLRQKLKLTQQEFADRLGIAIATMVRYENNRVPRGKSLSRLEALAAANSFGDLAATFRTALVEELGALPSSQQSPMVQFRSDEERDLVQALLDILRQQKYAAKANAIMKALEPVVHDRRRRAEEDDAVDAQRNATRLPAKRHGNACHATVSLAFSAS